MRSVVRLWTVLAAAFAIGASAVPASAAFPGDNGKIVFSSNQSGFFELYSMFPDGSGLTQLTTPNQVPCSRGPWVSADGTRIAFHGNPTQACSGTNFQIYTVNADATGLTQLTFGGYNVTPAWSPDGSKIAYVSNQTTDGSCQIFEIGASGGTPKQITYLGPEGLGGLSWSPDSTKIVYGTAASSVQCPGPNGALNVGNLEIHVMNASDGSNDVRLETDGAFVAGTLNTSRHPDWSPDGSQITYASTRSGDLQVWTMNADGSGKTQVTHDPNTPENFSRFSPDGSQLVFQAAGTQGFEIRVVNVDGSHEMKVLAGKARNIQPSWGPEVEGD